jgi:hypothetical protein
MSRVTLGLLTAAIGLVGVGPAAAGGCCAPFGWGGFGAGCCGTSWGVVYAQPAPQVVIQPVPVPQPIIVPQPVAVPQPVPVPVAVPQPVYVPQPVAVPAPVVPSYAVEQGPYYSGPLPEYGPALYHPVRPPRPYPYVSGGGYWPRHTVRPWRYGARPYWRHPVRYGAYRPAPRPHVKKPSYYR